jgi:hypothetical protein
LFVVTDGSVAPASNKNIWDRRAAWRCRAPSSLHIPSSPYVSQLMGTSGQGGGRWMAGGVQG